MAASKRKKRIDFEETKSRITQGEKHGIRFSEKPAWGFSKSDTEMWAFSQEQIGELFWTEILPRLKSLETQTWSEILVKGKKQNHLLSINDLNKIAQDRISEIHIEPDSIISLRVTGNHRLYGCFLDDAFRVLWYDKDHGDNDTCVCRSRLKHT